MAAAVAVPMLEHYSPIRKDAKRRALAAICAPKPAVTKTLDVTKIEG
jgi:hypothetical protein